MACLNLSRFDRYCFVRDSRHQAQAVLNHQVDQAQE
jgi:hypothetical protein